MPLCLMSCSDGSDIEAKPTESTTEYQHIFTAEKDGVTLTVDLGSEPLKAGEHFVLTASVTNNTGKTIYTTMPTGTENMHYEIGVDILGTDSRDFMDRDTFNKIFTCDVGLLTLEDGETYTQVMNMSPGYCPKDWSGYSTLPPEEEMVYFDIGTYCGTAHFDWYYENPFSSDERSELTNLDLDFDVVLV